MYSHNIKLKDVYTGFKFKLTHLDGNNINIHCEAKSLISTDNFIQTVRRKGLPYYDEEKEKIMKGNLYIRFIIELPQQYFENVDIDIDVGINEECKTYISKSCEYHKIYKNIDI
jgi:DnaJ-class molecular chaperone